MIDEFAFLSDAEFQQALVELEEATRQAKGKRKVEPLMRRLELSLRRAFREQGKKFLRKFRTQLRNRFAEGFEGHAAFLNTPLKESITPTEWLMIWYEVATGTLKLFSEPIEQAVNKALLSGAIQSIADIGMGISFSLSNPRAEAYLRDYGALRVAGINEETQSQLQTILKQAINEGWS